MNITIHRGTDQIGGSVTEYEYDGWRLFVDYGEQLPGAHRINLRVEGLTHGDLSKSVLLITHYHGDHVGCIADLPEDLPIYIGKSAKEILEKYSCYIGKVDKRQKALNLRLKSIKTFTPGHLLKLGDFHIMPITMDHSAFDAYGFCIEVGGLKAFHTGDFRAHGFRSSKFTQVIKKYVGTVDYLICEATNILRHIKNIKSERDLQKEFTQSFSATKFNVVYLSSTNIDRLFSIYHAAIKAHRPFYVDEYQKKIMDSVAGKAAIWGKSGLYRYHERFKPITLRQVNNRVIVNDNFIRYLTEYGYVIAARSNPKFDSFLSRIPCEGRKTYLSMWRGYLDISNPAYNPVLAHSIPSNYEYLHTSGHCDMESLEKLIEILQPKSIIPIHTESPQKFAELFGDKWPITVLKDGETFRPI